MAYEVSHPLIQETIYEEIGGAQRYVLHRRVGRALLVMGHLGAAAFHFARSADSDDNEAVEVLRSPLRQAEERAAYPEALKILGTFVDLLSPGDDRWLGGSRCVVSRGLGGRPSCRRRQSVRCAALLEIDTLLRDSPDILRRAEVKSRLTSLLSWGAGQLKEADPIAREALDLYERAGRAAEARLAALELAYVRGLSIDLSALEEGARAVLAQAKAANDEHAILQAMGALGTVLFYQGHFAESEEAARESVVMAQNLGKRYRFTWGLMSLGWSFGYEGRYEQALHAMISARGA